MRARVRSYCVAIILENSPLRRCDIARQSARQRRRQISSRNFSIHADSIHVRYDDMPARNVATFTE